MKKPLPNAAINSHISVVKIGCNDCPKFQTCNAPVCPLDKNWRKRKQFRDEKSCLYLLESSKPNAKDIFEGAGLSNLFEAIAVVREDILSSCAAIKRASKRAEATPSRLKPKFARGNKS